MRLRLPLLVLLAAIAAVPACGQKGPLVLPDAQHPHKKPKFPAQKPPAAPSTTPAPESNSTAPEPAPSPAPSTAPDPAPSVMPQS
jgi:predicted small lipoprotein YifL